MTDPSATAGSVATRSCKPLLLMSVWTNGLGRTHRHRVCGNPSAHMIMSVELGCSVHTPAPGIRCNFYIEFYE